MTVECDNEMKKISVIQNDKINISNMTSPAIAVDGNAVLASDEYHPSISTFEFCPPFCKQFKSPVQAKN
jgi:hypothetical protein